MKLPSDLTSLALPNTIKPALELQSYNNEFCINNTYNNELYLLDMWAILGQSETDLFTVKCQRGLSLPINLIDLPERSILCDIL